MTLTGGALPRFLWARLGPSSPLQLLFLLFFFFKLALLTAVTFFPAHSEEGTHKAVGRLGSYCTHLMHTDACARARAGRGKGCWVSFYSFVCCCSRIHRVQHRGSVPAAPWSLALNTLLETFSWDRWITSYLDLRARNKSILNKTETFFEPKFRLVSLFPGDIFYTWNAYLKHTSAWMCFKRPPDTHALLPVI